MLCFKNVLFLFTEKSSVKTNHPWSIFSFLISSLDRSVASKSLNNQGKELQGSHFKDCQLYRPSAVNPWADLWATSVTTRKHWILLTPTMNLYRCLQGWKSISLPSHTLLFPGKTSWAHSAGPKELSHRKWTDFVLSGNRKEQITWFGQSAKSTSVPISLHFALDHQVTAGHEN